MIPLGLVMRHILTQRSPQGALTKDNDLRQTLLLDRSHPAFGIGVQVRTSRRQRERLDLASLDDRSEGDGVLRLPVMLEIATVSKGAASLPSHDASHLLHPLLV